MLLYPSHSCTESHTSTKVGGGKLAPFMLCQVLYSNPKTWVLPPLSNSWIISIVNMVIYSP